jgi:CheY-like chemotaxis protein
MSETPNQELLKILIIDDDQVDRLAVRRALTQTDFQIAFTEAAGYDEAIAIFEFQIKHKQGFDCIFLDYQLPGRDGAALIDAIHHLNIFSNSFIFNATFIIIYSSN